ncbi:MAG: DNA alkylation repair protein, partial [Gammaproteobacteria bacterium]|nr:DNA alkylation repair protein [Gammaproteobacteria bacterium]
MAVRIDSELRALGNSEWAQKSRRFFKTGEGGYAATDEFVGIPMPLLRAEVKKRFPLPLKTISDLMPSSCHEVRLFALLTLVRCYERQDNKKEIVSTYLSNLEHVNNWDLVDCSAYKILGPYYLERDKSVLFELAVSQSLWERRVAIITTLHFIKNAHVQTTLELLDLL